MPSPDEQLRQAMDVSLRLLRFRGRSRHELRGHLERRGFVEAVVSAALARLEELGYLDDAAFARARATSLLRDGRFGARAVLQRLQAHGLGAAQAKRAVREAEEAVGFNPESAAQALLERRGLWGRALTARERGKAERLLVGRGFGPDVVTKLLGEEPSSYGD